MDTHITKSLRRRLHHGPLLAALVNRFGAARRLGVLSTISILGAIYSIWTIFSAGAEAFYWGSGLTLAGVPVYVAMKKLRRVDAVEEPR